MASKSLAKGLKRSALTVALGFCFIGGVQAQTNTAGAVSGRAAAGDTITITNPATGFSRTITVTGDGNYRISQLPIGQYTVTRNGGSARTVTVNIGTASNVDFVASTSSGAGATNLDTVTVVGTAAINPIDVSSVESTTILTAEQVAKIPVPRDITSVALLAPGTVRGDAAFGNLASFGGASVSENAYFVNGFNITNSFDNLNFAQLPFEAIAEQQTKTGGYGAEFGRALGGVVNVVTKSGSNEFHAGANIFWTPASLREDQRDRFSNAGLNYGGVQPTTTPTTPAPQPFEQPVFTLENNSRDSAGDTLSGSVWASGALIKDRLFAYGLLTYSQRRNVTSFGGAGATTNSDFEVDTPGWLLKMDWAIADDHRLELTAFSDKSESESRVFSNTSTSTGGNVPASDLALQRTALRGTRFSETGGETYSLKYTGYLTDNFTLSALYGHAENSRADFGIAANGIRTAYNGVIGSQSGCPQVIDGRPQAGRNPLVIPSCNFIGLIGSPDNQDTRDQFRLDAEWILGAHRIRAGIDLDEFESFAAESREGGAAFIYRSNTVVTENVFQTGATVGVDSQAFYVEDSWNVTDNFLAYIGLRWDTFENKNGQGETFVEIENQFQPRLGFSWDVFGDSTFKVFGNAGRYALPLTATVAVRGASASLFRVRDFDFTGIDPTTGAPTGLTLRPGTTRFLNNEFGVPKDASSIASTNLDPQIQDEFILGFQKTLTDNVSLTVRGIYRDLKRAIDDTCDYRPVIDFALANGFTIGDNPNAPFITPEQRTRPSDIAVYNPGFPFCRLYNPGSDGIFNMDINGDGQFETVTIPADVLGPEAKRKYNALEFALDGSWDRAFMQASYTYAQSIGNTEGGVKSDNGQDDTGTTQDFDYPELTVGSFGYLPNDRRHSFKLFGNYDLTNEWSIGGNLIVQSGRPINCFGVFDGDPTGYRNSYFSCDTAIGTNGNFGHGQRRRNGSTVIPRGSSGRTPWTRTLGLNVNYNPNWLEGLSFKMDVFNVFNERDVISVNEFGEDSNGVPQPTLYKTPTGFQTPRSVRFMVQYEF